MGPALHQARAALGVARAPSAVVDAAEQYALLHPRRAAEIRAYGGVPPTATYGPPEPETVLALITSTNPILQQIDKEYAQAVPA